MEEIYKQIFEFERYEVSNLGNVRRFDGTNYIPVTVQCKAKQNRKQPQYLIRIYQNKKIYWRSIGKLIAELFLPNPEAFKEIIYKDRNTGNYKASNIEWVDSYTWMIYCMGEGMPEYYGNNSLNSFKYKPPQKKIKKREEAILMTENSIKQSIKYLRYLRTGNDKYLMDILNENKKMIFYVINSFFKSEVNRNEMYSKICEDFFDATHRNIINGGLNLTAWFKSAAKNRCLIELKNRKPVCLYGEKINNLN